MLEQYLKPAFGPSRLDAIRPRDVAAYVRRAMREPAGIGRPLSAKFVGTHLTVLGSMFKTAIAEELVQANPVAGVE